MEQLIKVTKNENGASVCSAKDIYNYLEYDKSQWARWYNKNILNNDFAIVNVDYTPLDIVSNHNQTKDFAITLDFAKRLCMMSRTNNGEKLRLYFIECEKEYQKLLAKPKDLSRKELALLVIEIEEEREKLQETVELLHHTDKTYTSGELAKELNLKSAKQLNNLLHEKRVQFKKSGTWMLYSKYSGLDYVETKQEVTETGRVIYHRKWTNQGREFILRLLGKTLSV